MNNFSRPFSFCPKQKRTKTLQREGEEGNFNRKTTLHAEGKMHKAQKDEGRDTLMLMLTDHTKRGKPGRDREKRSERGRERRGLFKPMYCKEIHKQRSPPGKTAKAIEPCYNV